jgi:hypothetical protein
MERASFVLLTVALVGALALPVSRAIGDATAAHEPPVCRHMTPDRLLEDPALAQEWAQALRSPTPDAVARVRAMIDEIRAAHGCSGTIASPTAPPDATVLPPGHPPIPGHGELPPGHPPIPSSPRVPLFEAPAVLTI